MKGVLEISHALYVVCTVQEPYIAFVGSQRLFEATISRNVYMTFPTGKILIANIVIDKVVSVCVSGSYAFYTSLLLYSIFTMKCHFQVHPFLQSQTKPLGILVLF